MKTDCKRKGKLKKPKSSTDIGYVRKEARIISIDARPTSTQNSCEEEASPAPPSTDQTDTCKRWRKRKHHGATLKMVTVR